MYLANWETSDSTFGGIWFGIALTRVKGETSWQAYEDRSAIFQEEEKGRQINKSVLFILRWEQNHVSHSLQGWMQSSSTE